MQWCICCTIMEPIMKTSPLIEQAEVLNLGQLRIHWSTGESLTVDLSGLTARYPNLGHLEYFRSFKVDDWKHALEWPDGLDLGADQLYHLSRQQAGLPTPVDFAEWMERNHLSLNAAAEALGMSRRMMAHYKVGSRPIPKHVWLACLGWEALRDRQAA